MGKLLKLVLLFAVLIAGVVWVEGVDGEEVAARNFSTERRVAFGICSGRGDKRNCVVDGDSFHLGGEKIRILGVDAPEIGGAMCADERAKGEAARDRLRAILSSAPIRLTSDNRDRDQYGRLLRNVSVGGRDVGETLVEEGLARQYRGRKEGWCEGARS